MGESAAAAILGAPKLCQSVMSAKSQLTLTYKMPLARPRRLRNHSSTKLTQGAKRSPLEIPYMRPCVMITCTAFTGI